MAVTAKLLSSLVKVFLDEEPTGMHVEKSEGFSNETVSFQVAFTDDIPHITYMAKIIVESPIAEHVKLRSVQLIPHANTTPPADDYFLRTEPGLYPDRLAVTRDNWVTIYGGQWRSVWVDIYDAPTGVHPIKFTYKNYDGEILAQCSTSVEIFPAALPLQNLRHTKWFHTDCLAEYYHVETWSERHWEIIGNFIETAVKRGINMVLTPTFTPPLDTAVGHERLTTQLVEVTVTKGKYSFGFEKLRRWVNMCQNLGVEYFEIAHLFTQWGAKAAPKVMATVDGEYKRIFGWDTPALSEGYTTFLGAYLPALTGFMKEIGIDKSCYFHLSDEPGVGGKEDAAHYNAAMEVIAPYLKDFRIIDALSDLELYKSGGIDTPVPCSYTVEAFLDVGMTEPWVYYCGAHQKDISNFFITMPSARNRVLGLQLYKFGIRGFLHWGYNFYGSFHSLTPINPYSSADATFWGFNANDGYQVYPGSDGKPEESLRIMVFAQAIYDMRALQMLESLTDKAFVINLMEEGIDEPITFTKYPRGEEYLLILRQRVNDEIMKRI
ncbi:MAG: DUF4091 domain-containing protein [Defluviitaleaceae bacterium]|nr:DUF4091 domain-containing protein [Defluviitaleaceae bacterium]